MVTYVIHRSLRSYIFGMTYQPQTADINGIRNRARQLTNTSAQMYFCRVSHELLTPFVVRDVSLYLILTYDIPICAEFDRKNCL